MKDADGEAARVLPPGCTGLLRFIPKSEMTKMPLVGHRIHTCGTRYFIAGVTIRCYRSSSSIQRPTSSSALIQRPETHQVNTMDGQIFQTAESACSLLRVLFMDRRKVC